MVIARPRYRHAQRRASSQQHDAPLARFFDRRPQALPKRKNQGQSARPCIRHRLVSQRTKRQAHEPSLERTTPALRTEAVARRGARRCDRRQQAQPYRRHQQKRLDAAHCPCAPTATSATWRLPWNPFSPRRAARCLNNPSLPMRPDLLAGTGLGYKFEDSRSMRFDAFNLLNREASQIDYVCRSRLASETGEVEDIHFHPLEPRSFRLSLTKQW